MLTERRYFRLIYGFIKPQGRGNLLLTALRLTATMLIFVVPDNIVNELTEISTRFALRLSVKPLAICVLHYILTYIFLLYYVSRTAFTFGSKHIFKQAYKTRLIPIVIVVLI